MKTLVVLAALVALACALKIDDSEVHEQWQNFKATHGKTYKNEAEEEYRKKIFKEKLTKIAKHNARYEDGEVSYTMGINKYSDMLSHEVKEMMNGFRPEMKKASTKIHNPNEVQESVSWPWSKTVDWRKKGYVTPIKDQGQCGSCWAFSTTGSLEGQLYKKTKKLVSLSEQQLVDCSWDSGNEGCDGGLMDNAFTYIKSNGGIDTENTYPYTAEDGTCSFNSGNVAGTDTGFVDIKSGSESDLKDAVKKIGPISVAIDASADSFQSYSGGVYHEASCSSTELDHGVLAVGYGTEKGQDYWLVKNSWGTSWGEEGYIKMARNKNNNCGIATMASYPTV